MVENNMTTVAVTHGWRPLFDTEQRQRILVAVDEIARELCAWPAGASPASLDGYAAMALFFWYRALYSRTQSDIEQVQRLLNEGLETMGDLRSVPSLHGGFVGLAWVLEHLLQMSADGKTDDDPNAYTDDTLFAALHQSPWPAHFDLISGLVGIGIYALERWPRPTAVRCLERVVDRLAEPAEARGVHTTWHTAPGLLHRDNRRYYPTGCYDLGVAHGVAAIIALLGRVCAVGVAVTKAQPLLERAVAWLLAQQLPPGHDALFPTQVVPGQPCQAARLAWCYGDAGIAAALLVAADAIGHVAWRQEAIAIARAAVCRPHHGSGVFDAGLCHGSAGLMLIFQRFFVATGEGDFLDAAQAWCQHTLAQRRPGHGIGGYQSWEPQTGAGFVWKDSPGLLTGAAGIGLALLAAATSIEPAWDRVLAISTPVRTE